MEKVMKKWKIISLSLLIIVGIIVVAGYLLQSTSDEKGSVYQLGKTPSTSQCTFGEDFLLCKEEVWENGEPAFKGLYIKELGEDISRAARLLSDDYYAYANVYDNEVIFVDNDQNIVSMDLKGENKQILVDNGGRYITDVLVIEGVLYYLAEVEEEMVSLCAMDLKTKEKKQLANDVNFHYLYHYCGSACVLSRKDGKILICNMDEGVVQEYDGLEYEIIGFLNDGTVIYYSDGVIYKKSGLSDEKAVKLLEMDNIYRIILHPEEMLICTWGGGYPLMEIFIYSFEGETLEKIANTNTLPRDFNAQYIVCQSEEEAFGDVEAIDRKSGEMIYIATDAAKSEPEMDSELPENVSESENVADESKEAVIQKVLEDYFDELLSTMLVDSDKDYSKAEFDSINGYIIAKELVFRRKSNRILSEEIHSLDLTGIELEELSGKEKKLKAVAVVKYTYYYTIGDGEEEKSSASCTYNVSIKKSGGTYRVTDIDNKAIETRLVKSAIKNVQGEKEKYRRVDAYFGELLQGVRDME